MKVQFTMHADETSNLYVVEQKVTVPYKKSRKDDDANRIEIRRRYFVIKYESENGILSVS